METSASMIGYLGSLITNNLKGTKSAHHVFVKIYVLG